MQLASISTLGTFSWLWIISCAFCTLRAVRFKQWSGRNLWGMHPVLWGIIGLVLGPIGSILSLLAVVTSRRSGQGSLGAGGRNRGGRGGPGYPGGPGQYGPGPGGGPGYGPGPGYGGAPGYGGGPAYGTPVGYGPGPGAPPAPAVPGGWKPDPSGKFQYRYWTGTNWSEHVSTDGVTSTDPVPANQVPIPAAPSSPNTGPAMAPLPPFPGPSGQASPPPDEV